MPNNRNHNQRIGKWGEQIAIDTLVAKGYQILERNVFTPYGEIDLVARLGQTVAMVEVKTRTNTAAGQPEEAITAKKYSHMAKAAEEVAASLDISAYQLDVIAIVGTPGAVREVIHFENI